MKVFTLRGISDQMRDDQTAFEAFLFALVAAIRSTNQASGDILSVELTEFLLKYPTTNQGAKAAFNRQLICFGNALGNSRGRAPEPNVGQPTEVELALYLIDGSALIVRDLPVPDFRIFFSQLGSDASERPGARGRLIGIQANFLGHGSKRLELCLTGWDAAPINAAKNIREATSGCAEFKWELAFGID